LYLSCAIVSIFSVASSTLSKFQIFCFNVNDKYINTVEEMN
jgi:hypothetical protein